MVKGRRYFNSGQGLVEIVKKLVRWQTVGLAALLIAGFIFLADGLWPTAAKATPLEANLGICSVWDRDRWVKFPAPRRSVECAEMTGYLAPYILNSKGYAVGEATKSRDGKIWIVISASTSEIWYKRAQTKDPYKKVSNNWRALRGKSEGLPLYPFD